VPQKSLSSDTPNCRFRLESIKGYRINQEREATTASDGVTGRANFVREIVTAQLPRILPEHKISWKRFSGQAMSAKVVEKEKA